ncbi:MAG TPA: efflux RND transporter periplasmic adaptor subunit [Chryseolinea sp.]|nr:efflux RND transporter periplasmic adaptor subunit [Chryseolinea sp.]HPH46035.1 efflux RND transporter periplasmic adaptor subunit [Chryseolinea sp.]HPM31045.1 efflux RND transporter periplasmic adaptor subunit [Chryseolinea sp.]
MKNRILLFSLFIYLLLSSCNKKEKHQHQAAKDQYTCPMHPQIIQDKPGTCPICGMDLVKVNLNAGQHAIMLNQTQMKLANITTTLVRFQNIGNNTILTGKLVADETQTEVISSRVQGRIEVLYIKEIGQQVKQGQALYQLYSENLLTLQQEYVLALKQAEAIKEDRYQWFVASAEKKLTLFGMTKSQIENLAKKKVVDSRITFYAPVSGYIKNVEVSEGQYISEGSLLYRIEKLDKLWMEAELYPGEAQYVKTGDEINVSITDSDQNSIKGRVTFMSPEYRKGSQVMLARVEIKNADHKFLPGMQGNIILTHSGKKAIAVPVDAVIRDASGNHIWILQKDGSFISRKVKTGVENSEMVEIVEGLSENENVVITGAYLLYSESVLKKRA